MLGSPLFPLPIHERVSTVHRGRDRLQVLTDSTMYSVQGMSGSHRQGATSHTPVTIGKLWIALQALVRVMQGQRIARCAVVGTATGVSSVTAETVTLSEAGPLHRYDSVFDLRTGVLLRSAHTRHVGGSPRVEERSLVSGSR